MLNFFIFFKFWKVISIELVDLNPNLPRIVTELVDLDLNLSHIVTELVDLDPNPTHEK